MPRGEADLPIPEDKEPESSPRAALLVLIVIVVMAVGGVFLCLQLSRVGVIQDCVAQGRTNCAPVAVPPRG
ncbi:MAG: hypothetical protein ACREFY_15470 [Acetobacteraceae bacterium]